MENGKVDLSKGIYKEKENSAFIRRGLLNNKDLMRSAHIPHTLDGMQAIARNGRPCDLGSPQSDKFDMKSFYGPSGHAMVRYYSQPRIRELIESFKYPSHHSIPKKVIGKNETGVYNFALLNSLDEKASIQTYGNGVRLGCYLFDDPSKVTLQGNNNAYSDERLYSLAESVHKVIKKIIKKETQKAEKFFNEVFLYKKRNFKRDYKFRHRYSIVELFWVIKSFNHQEVYEFFTKAIEERFGHVTAKINSEGSIQDSIKYRFESDELYGVVVKIYRFDEDLIKFEVQFTADFFGTTTKNYRFLEVCPVGVYSGLIKQSREIFYKILNDSYILEELSLPKHICEKRVLKIVPKYGYKIIDMFKVGNGFCYINSGIAPHLYRSIRKLVKAGLVYKLKNSRYQISNDIKALVFEGE